MTSMKQVLLLVMFAGVGHALFPVAETKCNAMCNTSLCSSSLGGSVYIQVMTNASGHLLLCKKQLPTGSINVFTLKKEKVLIQESFRSRTEFFISNGTLKISNVEEKDFGQYNIEIFNPDGFLLRRIEVILAVQKNFLPILIAAGSAVGVLLLVVILCCVCRRARRKKKEGKKKLQYIPEENSLEVVQD